MVLPKKLEEDIAFARSMILESRRLVNDGKRIVDDLDKRLDELRRERDVLAAAVDKAPASLEKWKRELETLEIRAAGWRTGGGGGGGGMELKRRMTPDEIVARLGKLQAEMERLKGMIK